MKLQKGIKNDKGFTLVEVIVVLVILAAIAAILIPSLTGWIDKARAKTNVVSTREIYLAAQTAISETYGENGEYFKTDISRFKYGPQKNFARISDNMLYKVQNNKVSSTDTKADALIAEKILGYVGSSYGEKNKEYTFVNKTAPTTETAEAYENKYDQPGIIIFYTKDGRVAQVQFGSGGYLCVLTRGKITTTKNGVFDNNYK